MAALDLGFQTGSVHLPGLGLWLDPHEPLVGPERAFVSHAHSDHIGEHREVILSAPTAKLMQARLPGVRQEHVLEFHRPGHFQYQGRVFEITLLPAGHIFGSAMSLIRSGEETLLYTGDFKLRRGLSAERCEPSQAEILVMETTFGRPQYAFPPTEAVLKSIVRFCREALDNDEVPVLLGYSLGKSQELLCSLGDASLPIMLHGTIFNLTRIYEQFGQCFPKYDRYEAGAARGKVLLCPPNVINSAMLRNLGKTRTAILTGWAVDPNCRYRYQCDAAFPLSDHADYPDLVELVRRVQPKRVYTMHGFAADFAQSLRVLGFDARALSENEQFALNLVHSPESRVYGPHSREVQSPKAPSASQSPEAAQDGPSSTITPEPDSFAEFAETCSRIGADNRKLEKVRFLAEYLRGLRGDALAWAATWFTGRPFASAQNKVLQLGWAVIRDALCGVADVPEAAFHQAYLKHSDLGETAAELLEEKSPHGSLSLQETGALFSELHAARGPLGKTPVLKRAFDRCTARQAKYLVKIITGDLRIGLKEGLVEEAIASAFGRLADQVRQANLLLGDIGETAKLAAGNRLSEAALVPFRPARFMLASPEETAADVWERMVGTQRALGPADQEPKKAPLEAGPAVWLEDKYDGIRCQLHKVGERVSLYSRDLREITRTFLDVVDKVRKHPADFVLDGEILAMRGEEVLPFAELQKRLGRREGDLFMRDEVPIQYVAFDLLWVKGKTLLNQPLRQRRAELAGLSPLPAGVRLARITQAASPVEIEAAFEAARARGNEGLMVKDPESVYAPGRRGLAWLKLKKAFATLDCVVIGAEYGHGKRNKVLSDYTFAVRDEVSGELKTIGKAYTGLTDQEIADLTAHFLTTAVRQHGRYFEVPPETVLEIAFDRLQRSERHNSGLAMRFPRIVRIRKDKSVADIDTLQGAWRLLEKLEKKSTPICAAATKGN